MLKYSKRYLPLLTIQSMYKSLIEPYFRYCCPAWGSCGSTAINELQKLQNRAARIVTNSRYDASAKPIIKKLGWHTVSANIQMETLSIVYKSINDLAPIYRPECSQGSRIHVRENYAITDLIWKSYAKICQWPKMLLI